MKLKTILIIFAVIGSIIITLTAFSHSDYPGEICFRHGPEAVKKRIDKRLAELNLDGEQQKQVDALKLRIREDMVQGMTEKSRALDGIASRLREKNPDVPALAKDIKSAISEKGPEKVDRVLGYGVAFYDILDDGQKAMVVERLRERIDRAGDKIDRFSEWRGRHGKDGPPRFRHADRVMKELDLTPAQAAKLKETAALFRHSMIDRLAVKKEFIAEIDAKLAEANPDMESIAFKVKGKAAERLAGEFPGIDAMVDFYGELNRNQKEKVIAHFLERIEKVQSRIETALEELEKI